MNGPNWSTFNSFQGKANNKFHEDFVFQLIGSLRMREVEFKPNKPQKTAFTIKRTQESNTCLKPEWQSDTPLQLPYWACCNGRPSVQPRVSVRSQFHSGITTHHLPDGCIGMVCCCRYQLQWLCNKGTNSYAFSRLYLLTAPWGMGSPLWVLFFLQSWWYISNYRHNHFCLFSWSLFHLSLLKI